MKKIKITFPSWLTNDLVIKTLLIIISSITYAIFLSWKVAFLIMILIYSHEYGHLWAMNKTFLKNKGFYFIPFWGGGTVKLEGYRSYWQEIFVINMGPLFGSMLGLALALAYKIAHIPLLGASAFIIMIFNAFNLIPALPLDGGHILKSFAFSLDKKWGIAILTTITLAIMAVCVPILGPLWAALVFLLGLCQLCIEIYFLVKRDDPSFPRRKIPKVLAVKPRSLSKREALEAVCMCLTTCLILLGTWYLTKDLDISNGLIKYFK